MSELTKRIGVLLKQTISEAITNRPVNDGYLEITSTKKFAPETLKSFQEKGFRPRFLKKVDDTKYALLFDDTLITKEGREQEVDGIFKKINPNIVSAHIVHYDDSPYVEVIFKKANIKEAVMFDIEEVKDIPENWKFISDSQDVKPIQEDYPSAKKYDSFFVELNDGNYENVYGMMGIVADLHKTVYPVVVNGKEIESEMSESVTPSEQPKVYIDSVDGKFEAVRDYLTDLEYTLKQENKKILAKKDGVVYEIVPDDEKVYLVDADKDYKKSVMDGFKIAKGLGGWEFEVKETINESMMEDMPENYILKMYQDELKSLIGQIKYSNDAINHPDIENWEKKEFQSVLKDAENRKEAVEKHIEFLKTMKF